MSKMNYQQDIDEVVDMTHNNFMCRPHEKGYIITEAQAALLTTAEQKMAELKQKQAFTNDENLILRGKLEDYEMASDRMQLLHSIPPVAVCLLWVLGAMEGLADPVFTGIATVACGLWAAVNWKWGKVRA